VPVADRSRSRERSEVVYTERAWEQLLRIEEYWARALRDALDRLAMQKAPDEDGKVRVTSDDVMATIGRLLDDKQFAADFTRWMRENEPQD